MQGQRPSFPITSFTIAQALPLQVYVFRTYDSVLEKVEEDLDEFSRHECCCPLVLRLERLVPGNRRCHRGIN